MPPASAPVAGTGAEVSVSASAFAEEEMGSSASPALTTATDVEDERAAAS